MDVDGDVWRCLDGLVRLVEVVGVVGGKNSIVEENE